MRRFLISILIPLVLVASVTGCGGNGTSEFRLVSASQTDVVTSFDLITTPAYDGWFVYNENTNVIDNSLASFVVGPATPPLGDSSIEISVTGSGRAAIGTYRFTGTPLAGITELGYSTYNSSTGSSSASNAGYLNVNVDFNGSDTWQRRLVYVPRDNPPVIQDQWQAHDCLQGGAAKWQYSGPVWPGTAVLGTTTRTWSDILSSYPGVRIRVSDSFVGVKVGEGSTTFTENVDKFVLNTAANEYTADFERTSLEACRDHWAEMGYENFGKCVSSHKNKGQQGRGH